MRRTLILTILALLAGLEALPAWADCRADYEAAVQLLDTTRKKSLNSEHPDPDEFAREFQTMVDRMEDAKCMPELTSLVKYIHAEQQKFPAPTASKRPNPITD